MSVAETLPVLPELVLPAEREIDMNANAEQPLFLTLPELEQWLEYLERLGDIRMRVWGLVAMRTCLRNHRVIGEGVECNRLASYRDGTIVMAPEREPSRAERARLMEMNRRRRQVLSELWSSLDTRDRADFQRMEDQGPTRSGISITTLPVLLVMAGVGLHLLCRDLLGLDPGLSALWTFGGIGAGVMAGESLTRRTTASAERQGGRYSVITGFWSSAAAYSMLLALGHIPRRGSVNMH